MWTFLRSEHEKNMKTSSHMLLNSFSSWMVQMQEINTREQIQKCRKTAQHLHLSHKHSRWFFSFIFSFVDWHRLVWPDFSLVACRENSVEGCHFHYAFVFVFLRSIPNEEAAGIQGREPELQSFILQTSPLLYGLLWDWAHLRVVQIHSVINILVK